MSTLRQCIAALADLPAHGVWDSTEIQVRAFDALDDMVTRGMVKPTEQGSRYYVMTDYGRRLREDEPTHGDVECIHCGSRHFSFGLLPLCPKCTRAHAKALRGSKS